MIQKYYLHIESVILQVYCNQTCNTEYESRRNRTGHLWDERLMLSPLRFQARLSICDCNKPAELHFLFVNITSEFLKQESWHMTHATWNMIPDTWHLVINVQKKRSLALMVCFLWCFEELKEKDRLLNYIYMYLYIVYIIYIIYI